MGLVAHSGEGSIDEGFGILKSEGAATHKLPSQLAGL